MNTTINTKNIMVLLVNDGIKSPELKLHTNKMKNLGKEGHHFAFGCTHDQRVQMQEDVRLNSLRNQLNFFSPQLFAGTPVGKHFNIARRVVAIPEKKIRAVKFESTSI